MNRVRINEKDVDLIFNFGSYWLHIHGGLWVKKDKGSKWWWKKVLRNLHGEDNFGIIVKKIKKMGVIRTV